MTVTISFITIQFSSSIKRKKTIIFHISIFLSHIHNLSKNTKFQSVQKQTFLYSNTALVLKGLLEFRPLFCFSSSFFFILDLLSQLSYKHRVTQTRFKMIISLKLCFREIMTLVMPNLRLKKVRLQLLVYIFTH